MLDTKRVFREVHVPQASLCGVSALGQSLGVALGPQGSPHIGAASGKGPWQSGRLPPLGVRQREGVSSPLRPAGPSDT